MKHTHNNTHTHTTTLLVSFFAQKFSLQFIFVNSFGLPPNLSTHTHTHHLLYTKSALK